MHGTGQQTHPPRRTDALSMEREPGSRHREIHTDHVSVAFDYTVTTQRLFQPIGGVYHYAAKIRRLHDAERGDPGSIRMPCDEAWGETEEEAQQKAQAIIERLARTTNTEQAARHDQTQ